MSASLALYRMCARRTAAAVDRFDFVESVYLRRSVAVGEVVFGRSDIDLAFVISPDTTGADLLALARRVRALRIAMPMLGHCEVHTRLELARWHATDPYRASIDRRHAILLRGEPVEIPDLPIRPEHAARRLAFWFDDYLPLALRRRRILKKLAYELANACAVGTGLLERPLSTRREVREVLDVPVDDPLGTWLELGARLHQALLPPLRRLDRPLVWEIPFPPFRPRRTVVVVPEPGSALPDEAARPDALVCTPEVLDLLVQFVNSFVFPWLPDEVRRLGLQEPTEDAFVRSARYLGAGHRLRAPGLWSPLDGRPALVAGFLRSAVPALVRAETPPAFEARRERPRSYRAFYLEDYPALAAELSAAWAELDGLSDRWRSPVSAASRTTALRDQL
jgi:hypothetical protein